MSDVLEVAASDDLAFQRAAQEHGWSDGLPVFAPTEERVTAMLASVDADADLSLGRVPPSGFSATLDAVAANAVMAGCEPRWFPVVLAALSPVLDPTFNLEGIGPTTHPVSTFVLVNGPAREWGFNSDGDSDDARGRRHSQPGAPADPLDPATAVDREHRGGRGEDADGGTDLSR